MDVPPKPTCAITATYGQRTHSLEQALGAAFESGVARAIVVADGVDATTRARLEEWTATFGDRVQTIVLPENRGPAAAYAAGLEHAMAAERDKFIWLLDDDNRPRPDALSALQSSYDDLAQRTPPQSLMLLSLREDREQHLRLARGTPEHRVFPRASSFLGFHCRDIPRKFAKLLGRRDPESSSAAPSDPIAIPFGPYGGLFFHREAAATAGMPDPRFFLYGDDIEFTDRFVRGGGRLFLVPTSRIEDLEPSWHVATGASHLFGRLLDAESDARVYYSVRNQVVLERHRWTRSRLAYLLHRTVFFALLGLFAIGRRRGSRFGLIRRAARHGERQELGRPKELTEL